MFRTVSGQISRANPEHIPKNSGHKSGSLPNSFRNMPGMFPDCFRKMSGNIQKLSGKFPDMFCEHFCNKHPDIYRTNIWTKSRTSPENSRTCPGNCSGHFREISGEIPGKLFLEISEHKSRKFAGKFRELSSKVPGDVREIPGKLSGNVRE